MRNCCLWLFVRPTGWQGNGTCIFVLVHYGSNEHFSIDLFHNLSSTNQYGAYTQSCKQWQCWPLTWPVMSLVAPRLMKLGHLIVTLRSYVRHSNFGNWPSNTGDSDGVDPLSSRRAVPAPRVVVKIRLYRMVIYLYAISKHASKSYQTVGNKLVMRICIRCFVAMISLVNLMRGINLRPAGGGVVEKPPPPFFSRLWKTGGAQRRRFWHTLLYIFFAHVVKISDPGHAR